MNVIVFLALLERSFLIRIDVTCMPAEDLSIRSLIGAVDVALGGWLSLRLVADHSHEG